MPELAGKISKDARKAKARNLSRAMWFFLTSALWLIVIPAVGIGQTGGLSRELLMHLPIQLFWTWCLFQLNEAIGAHYKRESPVSNAVLAAISVSSYILMPVLSPYNFESRWLDPFFLAWIVSQSLFYVKAGQYLDHAEVQDKGRWKMALLLPLCASLYLPFSVLSPTLITSPLMFGLGWFACQFLALGYLATSMKQSQKAATTPKVVYPLNLERETIIRYRDFSAIERWFRQFFASSSGKKTNATKLMSWYAVPLSVLMIVAVLPFATTYMTQSSPSASTTAPAVLIVESRKEIEEKAQQKLKIVEQNMSLMMTILFALSATSGAAILYLLLRPSFVALSDKGMRFRWKTGPFQNNGACVQWQDLTYIDLLGSKDNSANASLNFQLQNGKQFKLKLNAIETGQEKEAILKSIQAYAPLVERDSRVIECLQPPADHSYTELWLQALTAPPQRERLQPLRTDASLQDGKYKVVKSIGIGGQGQAYLATTAPETNVVLKEFILPLYVDVAVRKSALEQFQNEAQLLRHIDHHNIVKLIDFFVEDHRAYLVLEHIDGASLRQIVESRGKLPEATVRELTAQMCKMLTYLHSLTPPIVHRDFTPDNLILNKDGTLKLIDFNVAKQLVESHTVGTVVGKHAYLPPEQFRGNPVPQSDIYAMGGTLQYLLTGEDPTPVSVSSPITRDSSISLALDNIVRKSTALNVKDRYQTVGDIEVDLEEVSPE